MKFKIRTDCSLCSSQNLQQVLELPKTPLANELILKKKTQDHYPLSLLLCISCGHLQLKEIIPPNRLFRKYLYVSGTSSVFIKHFENAASHIVKKTNIDKKDLIIEIGSNDGTLLKKFQYLGFNNTLGVDPANKIANIANKNGVETIPEFFNESVSNKILSSKGKARVILANNVFAHSSDLIGITNAIYSLLDEKGYFIFEVSYLLDVIEKLLFDTIYHEHLSYHALKPLVPFFKKNGLHLFDVERINTHGGSIRCYVSKNKRNKSARLNKLLKIEETKKLFSLKIYKQFSKRIQKHGNELKNKISYLKKENKRICGFGAPAKLTTLMYTFNLRGSDFEFIIDDSKYKQGLLTPGLHIPIVSSNKLYEDDIEVCVVFAWNFFKSIIKSHSKWKINGKLFINPLKSN